MATQSNGIQQRTRTKTTPSFPRERQPSQQEQQQPQPLLQQPHPGQAYYLPQNPQYLPSHQRSDVDGWCPQSLQSAPLSGSPRRSSRGPRTASPTRSIDSQGRVFTWDQSGHYPSRQNFRRKSVTSNTSSSDHHTLLRSPRPSRSPSPGTPRSSLPPRALRTPATVHEYNKRSNNRKMTGQSNAGSSAGSGCRFETALVNSRRRIPYSVGSDTLTVVPPGSYLARLDEKDERCLTVDILDLYYQLLPTEETEDRRRIFIDKLNKILRREFPNCYSEVHVFGSSENRLGTNSSDVDVCVVTTAKDMDDTYHFEKVVCVAAAKVPVVKIWDADLYIPKRYPSNSRNIHCDINVNNSLAIENTRFIKLYVDIDERVRPLAMTIKYWAKSRLLNDAAGGGTLTSYTWILMTINFLQTRDPPILPSLHKLPHRPRMSNGIDVGFFDDISKLRDFGSKNKETLGGLLYAFFVRFAFEFDYSHEVISVRKGGSLQKEAKGWHLMQNNSLCVEEPFNTNRNLGNTADEATFKGLQLEFRRAVHYLADHASLELACWPFQFPTAENPRPERHLPNIPPQFGKVISNNNRNRKYPRQQNYSPPFKSPKARAQDTGQQRHYNSFGASRQQYPFNPLNLNPPLPAQVPIPSTPQSGMSSSMSSISPAGDMHNAYPPTPVEQLHYIDPFKNRQLTYYIPAFAPNGLPVYVPYTEDPLIYASPPQTPAMSDASLSHQPQYPRSQQYGFPPQQYYRGQSVQRGRPTHRTSDAESPSTFRDVQPLTGIGISAPGLSTVGPPYVPQPMKRRNSLPPNNRPNVPVRPPKPLTESSYIPSPSSTSQGPAGSMSSVGGSDVFDEEYLDQRYLDDLPEASETPRPSAHINGIEKNEVMKSPSAAKASPVLPTGKSYAAALLNITPATPTKTQPVLPTISVKAQPAVANGVSEKDKKVNEANDKSPSLTLTVPTSPVLSPRSITSAAPASPIEPYRKPTGTQLPWSNNTLHPGVTSPTGSTPTSPFFTGTRRSSIQSTTSTNYPKKSSRPSTKPELGRKPSIATIPDSTSTTTTESTTPKKSKKKRNPKKKDNVVANGIVNTRRQSVTTAA